MKIVNSMTGKKEEFVPLNKGEVRFMRVALLYMI